MMKIPRVVLLGAKRVGKTALLNKYLQSFLDHVIESNSSQDVHNMTILFPDGQYHRVEFVDIDDLHEYPAMKEVYIQTGDAFVVVYAVDNRKSYEMAQTICQEITMIKGQWFTNVVMVGNKLDAKSTREISTENACDHIPETCLFTETSVKLNLNIKCPFILLFDKCLQNFKKYGLQDTGTGSRRERKNGSLQIQRKFSPPFRSRLHTV